jgi:hypothetical protein
MKNKIFYAVAVGVSIFILFFVVGSVWIGYEVKSQCQEAEKEYPPVGGQATDLDCVEALIVVLNDENKSFRARNSAIWALGQFGDNRAVPELEKYYTGNIPEREPLDKTISQYELKKALNLARGGFNISALVWRIGS